MKRKVYIYRLPFYIGLYLLILLIIIRALLPFWVRDYVNRKLSEVPEYRGHVAAVMAMSNPFLITWRFSILPTIPRIQSILSGRGLWAD
jgi:hypothetical protein